jgi:membrane protein DedA with SNARE-associated domain
MEQFIHTYGYLAVFLGSCIEGESVVLTAGFLAAQGKLSLSKIILIAFAGTLLADQLLFFFGRAYGERFLQRFPRWRPKADHVFALLHKYNTSFIMTFRFIYGIRIISPVIIGASGVSVARFAALNVIAAAVWAVLSCGVGYLFGEALRPILDHFDEYQRLIFIGLGGVVALIAAVIIWRKRTRSK